jgi:hypothetical protein
MALLIVLGVLALGFTFAHVFTDWHQVKVVKTECKHCGHTHKEYK